MEEIATFEYGYTISASEEGEFRFIRVTDIDEYGNISEKDKKYANLSSETDKRKYLLNQEDVIVARIGSVGETGIFASQEKSIFASYLIRINLNKDIILPRYYWYFTKTEEYWKQVEQLTKGTVQPQFNANSLKDIKVPIPRLEEQRKIIQEKEGEMMMIYYQRQTINLLEKKKVKYLKSLW